jgi:tetratricopeptide (TPR) repeat protein
MKVTAIFLVLAGLTVPCLRAQNPSAPSAGAAGGVSNSTGGIGSIGGRSSGLSLPTTPTTNPQSQSSTSSRPVFISGKVAIDDGTPVPSNITIQRVCSGIAHAVAYTDAKGHFSFQWGETSGVISDASEGGFGGRNSASSGGFGSAQSAGSSSGMGSDPFGSRMMNCELRAEAAGYRSSIVSLFTRHSMDSPDIGTIVLHRLANVEGTSISATSFLAPKDARKNYEKGLQSLLKNKDDDAQKDFEKAVAEYPKYADAWVNLGKVRMREKSFEPARDAFMKAIEADSKLVSPYVELGMLAAQEQKWTDSGQYLDRALKLDPIDFPQAWYVDAVANYNMKKYDAAEKSVREAINLDPKHVNPRSDYLLGLVLIEKQDYDGAAGQLRNFLKEAPDAPDADAVKHQLAQIEKSVPGPKEAAKQP